MANLAQRYIQLTRFHRPIGIWLLMWPCFWAVAAASPDALPWGLLVLFAIGAALMRSAGCIVNDMADRDFDAQVERTRTRPLASGELTLYQAFVLLCLLLSLALLVVVQMHPNLLYWAFGSLLFVAAYPFMKRITWWPQLFLGFTFNMGALFGWIAIHGEPHVGAWLLYVAGIAWTVGYDTIYGHQDIEDDIKIGVKSTAILFGRHTRAIVALWYSITVAALIATGYVLHYSSLYFIAILLCAMHLAWQVYYVDIQQPQRCLSVFKSNQWLGGMIFLAICTEILL